MKNIIFDVDGTLWDTTGVVAEAWNRAIAKVGGTSAKITSKVLKSEFGKTMDVIADDLFYDADREKRNIIMNECCKCEQSTLKDNTDNLLFPDVKETIAKLSERCHLFIVSNCQSGYIEMFMKKAGIEKYITDYECFGNTGKGKGENIKLIVQRNNLDEAVYVGDTDGDREAAVDADVPFIHAKYGFGSVKSCYMAINNIKELLNLCGEMETCR